MGRLFQPRVEQLYTIVENDAEAGRFVTFAHSRSSPVTVAQGRHSSLKT
jgi:hypothetical protein